MDHKSICEIIKVCVKSNIKELKFGELSISFFGVESKEVVLEHPESAGRTRLSKAQLSRMQSNDEQILRELDQQRKQEELDELLMNDPAKFEELIIAKELEASTDGGTEKD